MTTQDPTAIPVDRFVRPFIDLWAAPISNNDTKHLFRIVADTIAIAVYARTNRTGACAHDQSPAESTGSAFVWGTRQKTDAQTAAFLNATAAEALDFQEVFIDGRNNGHAAVVIVPALIALNSERGNSTQRLLQALRIGFAANALLARALGRGHRQDDLGFRTTSLTAPIAAAIAGGFLVTDNYSVATNAGAICAASLPAGLLAAMSPKSQSYSTDKDLAVGFSARHVVSCVQLALNGATGPSSAICGDRSWLQSFGNGTQNAAFLLDDPGSVDLTAYRLKLYPLNYGCQTAVSLAMQFAEKHEAQEIQSVEVHVKSSSAMSLSSQVFPTHVAARFSLKYAVASTLERKSCALEHFDAKAIRDPDVEQLLQRVRIVPNERFQEMNETKGLFPSRLIIKKLDNTVFDETLFDLKEGFTEQEEDAAFKRKIESLCDAGTASFLTKLSVHSDLHSAFSPDQGAEIEAV